MLYKTSSHLTETGIAALRAGDRSRAYELLTEATRHNPEDEQAWLWLAGATDDLVERRSYLLRVLALNPNSAAAKQGLSELGDALPAPLELPPLYAPPAGSSAGKTTTRLELPSAEPEVPALPPVPRGADDSFLVDYIVRELRVARPQSDIAREVADRLGGTWSEADKLIAYVKQQQPDAVQSSNYLMYAMIGGLALVAFFVLGGLYLFGKTLPPGSTPHFAFTRPVTRGMVAIAGGMFTLMGALFDVDWFMTNRRAYFVVALIGRSGARIFYGLLGAAMIVLGAIAMGMH